MHTHNIWDLADACIERGYFPQLTGRKFVLVMDDQEFGRSVLHRDELTFRLDGPCRVWLMCGRIRYLLGDSFALPGDISEACRPPWTG